MPIVCQPLLPNVASKLQSLRTEMQKNKIDLYIVPSVDAHNSEYVPVYWERRAWISNFDGSAGEVVVTPAHAYLFTDGRYFLQAENQLDSNHYTLIKQANCAAGISPWLLNNARGKTVGVDPSLLSIARANKLREMLLSIAAELVFIQANLIDKCRLRVGEMPPLPCGEAFSLPEIYTGESTAHRLEFMRTQLVKHGTDFIALNVLDEIAWVFNIRGSDIAYNPLVISYAIIGKHKAWLFVAQEKIPAILRSFLTTVGVEILDYSQFHQHLSGLHGSVWLDEKTANYSMLDTISAGAEVLFLTSPIVLAKACKNSVEIAGARNAHIKDATAVINFLHWLDNNWSAGITEMSCADTLANFRGANKNLMGLSFDSISGFAANGAIIHYRANPQSNKIVDDSSLYLIDSGGQYLEGTTDITRTVHLGTPTPQQKKHYTLVLKGHLALGRAIFPHGTCGEHLDVLARGALWRDYLNYAHGTGHGVGSFLCVHEGPQRISSAISNVPLVPGMIVSNEPGLYITGEYGIRIENLCWVNVANSSVEHGPFYHFEDLTLVPYAKKLIDIDLLSHEDKLQIKTYYAKITAHLRDKLGGEAQQWLDNEIDVFN